FGPPSAEHVIELRDCLLGRFLDLNWIAELLTHDVSTCPAEGGRKHVTLMDRTYVLSLLPSRFVPQESQLICRVVNQLLNRYSRAVPRFSLVVQQHWTIASIFRLQQGRHFASVQRSDTCI